MNEPITQEQIDAMVSAFRKFVETLETFFESLKMGIKRLLWFVRKLWAAAYPELADKMRKRKRYQRIYERYGHRQTA